MKTYPEWIYVLMNAYRGMGREVRFIYNLDTSVMVLIETRPLDSIDCRDWKSQPVTRPEWQEG
jgi:hypothetical protein